jgi:hypothetical protein
MTARKARQMGRRNTGGVRPGNRKAGTPYPGGGKKDGPSSTATTL